jgi:hypothetical protein
MRTAHTGSLMYRKLFKGMHRPNLTKSDWKSEVNNSDRCAETKMTTLIQNQIYDDDRHQHQNKSQPNLN